MGRSLFDLVIFDCDGVLVDSEPLVNRAFVEVVARDGVELDERSCLERFTGVSLGARVATVREEHGWRTSPWFERRFEARLAELVRQELRAVPGAADAVAEIRAPRCVASNGTLFEMTARLGRAGLLDRFAPHLFSAAERAHSKPFPDVYLHAASTMGVAPELCAVVEDSAPGVQAGVAAGMTVFGYAPDNRGDELSLLGARVFQSMAELPALLKRA